MVFEEAESYLKEFLSATQEEEEARKARTAHTQSLLKGGGTEKSWAELEENCRLAAEKVRLTRELARKAREALSRVRPTRPTPISSVGA